MIDFIQPAPVKTPVIADLEGLGLGDAPFHQGITVLRAGLSPMSLVSGNANVVQGVLLLFEPVDLLGDKVGL